jgi:hypothetical protein
LAPKELASLPRIADRLIPPFGPAPETIAHTLAHAPEQLGSAGTSNLVTHGEVSPEPVRATPRAVAGEAPHARQQDLPAQTHDVIPEVLRHVLEEFYSDRRNGVTVDERSTEDHR